MIEFQATTFNRGCNLGHIYTFLTGILEHDTGDFETVDDLYEAIGDMLLEVDGKGEDDIREICDRLMEVLNRYECHSFKFKEVTKATQNTCCTNL